MGQPQSLSRLLGRHPAVAEDHYSHTGPGAPLEEPYDCRICKESYSCSSSLKSNNLTHSGKQLFPCTVCDKSFSQTYNLKTPQRTHSGKTPYSCSKYGNFSQSNSLRTHMRIHTGEKPYPCPQCDQASSQSSNLKSHRRTHTGDKPSNQKLRQKSFTPHLPRLSEDFHRAGRRKEAHAGSQQSRTMIYVCNICGKRLKRKSSLAFHSQQHTGTKNYMCDTCDATYFTASALKNHKVNKHRETKETFLCTFCGKGFTKKANLESHITLHTKEKRYKCPQCKKRFRSHSTYQNPLRYHKEKGGLSFTYCGKALRQKYHLQRHAAPHTGKRKSRALTKHKRVHTGVPNDLCKQCGNRFSDSSKLAKHQEIHEKEEDLIKPLNCKICNKKFNQVFTQLHHMITHTDDFYKCAGCGKSFDYNNNFRKHVKTHSLEPCLDYWQSYEKSNRIDQINKMGLHKMMNMDS